MSKPTLYGAPFSPFVRKVRLALAVKGIDYDLEFVAPHADHEVFKAASPLGRIPAWSDDDVSFSDSSAIVQYLERFKGGAPLLPSTPAEYAKALWYEEYADDKIIPVVGPHLFAERVLAERLFGREPIQSDIDLAVNEEIPALCDFLEARMGQGPYLVTDTLNLGDLAVASAFAQAYHCGEFIDPERAPKLAALCESHYRQPILAAVLRTEVEGLAQFGYESPLAEFLGD